jgi:colicin import membrane protein
MLEPEKEQSFVHNYKENSEVAKLPDKLVLEAEEAKQEAELAQQDAMALKQKAEWEEAALKKIEEEYEIARQATISAEDKAIQEAAEAKKENQTIKEKIVLARRNAVQEAITAAQVAKASEKAKLQAKTLYYKTKRVAEIIKQRAEKARQEADLAQAKAEREMVSAKQALETYEKAVQEATMAQDKLTKDIESSRKAKASIEEKVAAAREKAVREASVAAQASELSGKARLEAMAIYNKAKQDVEDVKQRAEKARQEADTAQTKAEQVILAANKAQEAIKEKFITAKKKLEPVVENTVKLPETSEASQNEEEPEVHKELSSVTTQLPENNSSEDKKAEPPQVYQGTIKINLVRPVNYVQVGQYIELLNTLPNVQILSIGGSVNEGPVISIFVKEPFPLFETLSNNKLVSKVINDGKNLQIFTSP